MQKGNFLFSNEKIDALLENSKNKKKDEIQLRDNLLKELEPHTFSIKNLTRFTKDIISYSINEEQNKQNNHTSKNLNENLNKQINEKYKMKNKIKQNNDFFEPKQKDTLFWCLYVLLEGFGKYDMLGNQHFIQEKQLKFKYIEQLRSKKDILKNHKIRPLTELEDDLANKPQITLKTFIALSIINNLNIMVIHKHKYYETINNSSDNILEKHIIYRQDEPLKYSLDLYSTDEKMQYYRDRYYQMIKIDEKIKSVNSYKIEELVQLASKLGIEISTIGSKKKTKKEIYEMIILHF